MKIIVYSIIILSLFYIQICFADCQGCCSSHGGVACINGTTKCADGSQLSNTCVTKGCDACVSSSSSGGGGCFVQGLIIDGKYITEIKNSDLNKNYVASEMIRYNSKLMVTNRKSTNKEKVLWEEIYTYDSFNLVKIDQDYNGDGKIEMTTYFQYNDNGSINSEQYSYNDKKDKVIYKYDDTSGLLILEIHDLNCDDKSDLKIKYFYDNENRLSEVIKYLDDEFILEKKYYFYDSNSRIIKILRDIDNDGNCDESENYEYNEYEMKTFVLIDSNNDGIVDESKIINYDDKGRPILYEYDNNNDGNFDWKSEYIWIDKK